jgi:hypothetical protein
LSHEVLMQSDIADAGKAMCMRTYADAQLSLCAARVQKQQVQQAFRISLAALPVPVLASQVPWQT